MPLLNNLERFYLGKYLRNPRKYLLDFSSFYMIVGIIISVTVLSAGLNLFEGYQRTLQNVLLQSLSHVNIFHSLRENMSLAESESVLSILNHYPEIQSADPVINLNVIAHRGEHSRMCLLKAYTGNQSQTELWYRDYVTEGAALPSDNEIIIGYYLAQELGIGMGDTLHLAYPQLNRISAMGLYPGQKELTVGGIYRSGYYEFDRSLVIASQDTAHEFLLTSDYVSAIEVRLHQRFIDQADRLAADWEMELGLNYITMPWTHYYIGLFRLIEVNKWLVFVIFSFMVLIAGINVISAAQTVMLDKRNEIAIMKTIGAKGSSLRRLLMMRIGVTCALSILIGQIMGVLVSYLIVNQQFYHLKGDVYFIDRITMHVSMLNQGIVFATAVTVMLLCIMIPLRKMEKMQILDIFRTT